MGLTASTTPHKVVMVGPMCTGKTTLLRNMVRTPADTGVIMPTSGMNVEAVRPPGGGELQVWDCSGDARFVSLAARYYYENAHCLVYCVPCPHVGDASEFWSAADPVDFTSPPPPPCPDSAAHFAFLMSCEALKSIPVVVLATHADADGVDVAHARAFVEHRLNLRALTVPWRLQLLNATDPCQAPALARLVADMCQLDTTTWWTRGVPLSALLPRRCRHGRVFATVAAFVGGEDVLMVVRRDPDATAHLVALLRSRHRAMAAATANVLRVREIEDDDAYLEAVEAGVVAPLRHVDVVRVIWVLLTRLGRKEALREGNLWRVLRAAMPSDAVGGGGVLATISKNVSDLMAGCCHVTLVYFWVQQVELCLRAARAPAARFVEFLRANPVLSNAGFVFRHYTGGRLATFRASREFTPPDVAPLQQFVKKA